MAVNDKRSYNNADLSPIQVAALKKKSNKLTNVQVKVGSKKVELPAEAFLLTTESGHGFLSLQPINAVLQMKADNSYEAVLPKMKDEAVSALKAYRVRSAKKERKGHDAVPVSAELQSLLAKIPKGHKLVLKGDGYAIVKSRTRAKR